MLRTIISNQHLIMKALKIEVPVAKTEKAAPSKSATKTSPVKKTSKPAAGKKPIKRK